MVEDEVGADAGAVVDGDPMLDRMARGIGAAMTISGT